jgi:RNA recognition motif-containing protein
VGNKLYVGNLAYSVRDDSLHQAFSQFGMVQSAKVMMDRDTGRSKGFGFVEMGSDAEAQAAINGMNGQSLEGRAIVVNEARPREDRPGGFAPRGPYGGGGRSGGFGGGGGGGGRSGGGGYGGGGGGYGGGGGGYGGGGGGRGGYGRGGQGGQGGY